MIINLVVQHQKKVAWLLFFIFYGEMLSAALANRGKIYPGPFGSYTAKTFKKGGIHILEDKTDKGTYAQKGFLQMHDNKTANQHPHDVLQGKFDVKKSSVGPGQPEMQGFQSVNANNMVDLFSGDFSYNIPLLDVGGYPIGLSYRSGITIDQEASWVGLGWNVNPGTIMRNVRGLPDDFDGTEKVTKTYNVAKNWTAGITAAGVPEVFGFEVPKLNFSIGAFYNNYNGIGFEVGAGASVNPGKFMTSSKTTDEKTQQVKIDTSFTTKNVGGSLNFSLNSQQGLNLGASFMMKYGSDESKYNGISKIGLNYNSRAGLQDLQLSAESFTNKTVERNGKSYAAQSVETPFVNISFAKSSYTPTITIPSTNYGFSLTLKGGAELFGFHVNGSLRGYYSQQSIQKNDRILTLPAYGYMHYQKGNKDDAALLDFNREKDLPFRTQTPHTAIPVYTYDTYSISGEGIGGSFRPYRGDVGYVRDHSIRTKNGSGGIGIDLGAGPNLAHVGGDIQFNYATVRSGRWKSGNLMERLVTFQNNDSTYEAVYFRNPGEQTTNTSEYYDKIGGDDVVRVGMAGSNLEPVATPQLKRFDKQKATGVVTVNSPIIKDKRDKRSQVISYLTATEAQLVGLDTVIKSYPVNTFPRGKCDTTYEAIKRNEGGNGLHKPNHISEITVLNNDGRRYVYGIPAYNILKKEVTFAVSKNNNGSNATGLVTYDPWLDNTPDNQNGKDNFFSSDVTPGYAHSYLLTGLLSPDYLDITGNGITEDDNGDAVKFNYTRMKWNISGQNTTGFKWRAPYDANIATYHEGLKTDKNDDKANYVYGEKEIWYMNSIESKTMLATFVLDNVVRTDNYAVIGENGGRDFQCGLKRLKEINLYSKSDYFKNPLKARPVKTVHFAYSYVLCPGMPSSAGAAGKLTLDSVWFTYNGNNRSAKNKYRFNYHPNNPSYNNKSYDRWGNYKPESDNPNNVTNADYPYATQDKIKADDNAGAWNMVQVKLPSGASIKVDYESDDYAYVQNKRAMNMYKIAGMGLSNDFQQSEPYLYSNSNLKDYQYVFINVASTVTTRLDVYTKYLEGINKIYFKMSVKMPGNSGYEMVPFYAEYEDYGVSSANRIWVKLKTFGKDQSFPAIAAIQFLRLNLPGKAYPGSDVRDDAGPASAIKAVLGMGRQFKDAVVGFSKSKRQESICRSFDSTRSYIRLDNPDYKKMGGGQRVKRIVINDNWYNMTGQKESYYGQEYDYSTYKQVNFDSSGFLKSRQIKISSGVASYEPNIGNEENPFRQPIEFQESVTLAPTDYLYSEYPYGESFFPSASVGYSKVVVSSINKKNLKSFNGWEESEFYTTYDFPTVTDYTTFDPESRKRGNRKLNFINSLSIKRTTLSQGFKIELNDMNGKIKSTKSYAANDSLHPIAYTLNYYKTVQDNIHGTYLSNEVSVLDSANGKIRQSATIGKDIELMMDFREQQSLSTSVAVNANVEVFTLFIIPVAIPAFFPVTNINDNRFRSAVTVKVIQRYGILDSVMHYERGSLVSTKNMLYDAETGNVLLSRTQNEFNDPVYNFNYPAHWNYTGLEPAYRNIAAIFNKVDIDGGRITDAYKFIEKNLESGDELLVANNTSPFGICALPAQGIKAFAARKLWVVDVNKTTGTPGRELFIMDRFGNPYTGFGVSLKIIRSGKRNMAASSLGSITSLREPIDKSNPLQWQLKMDSTIGVISSGAGIFSDIWNVDNRYVTEYRCDTTVVTKTQTFYPTTIALQKKSMRGDGAGFGDMVDNIYFNPSLLTAGYEYLHSRNWPGGNCRTTGKNCWGSTHSYTYISRGILTFDGLKTIPSSATIDSARLDLYAKAPVGLWQHCNYWNSVSNAHAYFDAENKGFSNAGYIKRITAPWGAGTTYNRLTSVLTDLNRVSLSSSQNSCNDYNLSCKQLIKDYITSPSYGLVIMQAAENNLNCNIDQTRHLGFCAAANYGQGYGMANKEANITIPGGCVNCSQSPSLFVQYTSSNIICHDTCVSIFTRRFNPYVQGVWGNWRMNKSYTFFDDRKETDPVVQSTNIRKDGEYKKFIPFWFFGSPQLVQSNYNKWVWNINVTKFNKRGLEIETKDALGIYSAGLYGYNQTLPTAVAQNSRYRQMAFDGFEDYTYVNDICGQLCPPARQFDFSFYSNKIDSVERHTGKASLKLNAGETISLNIPVVSYSNDSIPGQLTANIYSVSCRRLDSISTNTNTITPVFSPLQGDSLLFGVWVKEAQNCKCSNYVNNQVQFIYTGQSGQIGSPVLLKPSGNIIEGWQRYEEMIKVPVTATNIQLSLQNISSGGSATSVYFDDIRLHPLNSNLKSFVYNPVSLRLMSELDENNYASFYEYDDEGTLVRVKKETQKGIKTIKETRSSLTKQ